MRALIWVIGIAAVLWTGLWWLAARGIERGVADWAEAQRAQGWEVDLGAVTVTGFPLSLVATVERAVLAGPAGERMAMGVTEVSAPAYWPGDLTLALPETPMQFGTGQVGMVVTVKDGLAVLDTKPGRALEVAAARVESAEIELRGSGAALATASGAAVALTQTADDPRSYHIAGEVTGLAPGMVLREGLGLPDGWPHLVEQMVLDGVLRFEAPLDRASFQDDPPTPRALDLGQLDLNWGPLALSAAGAVEIDAQGIPEGDMTVEVANWQAWLDMAQRTGTLPADRRGQAETVLRALSNLSGGGPNLTLPLTFAAGQMSLGPIPLGPAPKIAFGGS